MSLDFLNNLQITENTKIFTPAEMNSIEAGNTTMETKEEVKVPDGNPLVDFFKQGDPVVEAEKEIEPEKTETTIVNTGKYKAILEALFEKKGIEKDLSDFEDSPESLLETLDEIYTQDAESLVENYITSKLTPLQQRFVNLIEEGVSEEEATSIVKGYKLIEGVTEDQVKEDQDIASKVYSNYLRETTKFSDSKIQREVERLKELGTLEDEAAEMLPELSKIYKDRELESLTSVKQKEQEAQKVLLKQIEELNNYVDTTDEVAGLKLSKSLKDKWKKEFSLIDVETEQGKTKLQPIQAQRLHNPQEFDALMRLYNAIGLFKYDNRSKSYKPDFSALKSLGSNEATQKLKQIVESEQAKERNRKSGQAFDNTNEDVDVLKETINAIIKNKV